VRYKGEGINFGVSAYAEFPGLKYSVRNERGEIDYEAIQAQVAADTNSMEEAEILARDECDLAHFFPQRLREILALI
jgi:hypothetical protein